MNSIFKRKSVRKYKPGITIPREQLNMLVNAGLSAPSAGNERPCHFIVADEKSLLSKLSDTSPYSKMVAGASAAICVVADTKQAIFKDLWIQDCSAAVENILIEATELGLGSVWCCIYPETDRIEKTKHLFGLADNFVPFAVIALGEPEKEQEAVDRFDKTRIHYNKW